MFHCFACAAFSGRSHGRHGSSGLPSKLCERYPYLGFGGGGRNRRCDRLPRRNQADGGTVPTRLVQSLHRQPDGALWRRTMRAYSTRVLCVTRSLCDGSHKRLVAVSEACALSCSGSRHLTNGGRVLAVTGRGDNLAEAVVRAYAGVRYCNYDAATQPLPSLRVELHALSRIDVRESSIAIYSTHTHIYITLNHHLPQ